MSIWDKFPNLSDSELRTLIATTARVMLDSEEARSQLESVQLKMDKNNA
jgi:hypothetical protein